MHTMRMLILGMMLFAREASALLYPLAVGNAAFGVSSAILPGYSALSKSVAAGICARTSMKPLLLAADSGPGSNKLATLEKLPAINSANENKLRVENDKPSRSWIHSAPSQIRSYLSLARVDKPIGTWLVMWPCFWGIAMSSGIGALPSWHLLCMFAVIAFLKRGAGCTINDFFDRKIDAQVGRTKNRPIASGAVTPTQAIWFWIFQISAMFAVMLNLNHKPATWTLGVCWTALGAAYPLMKRITYWPQLFLGITMNVGIFMGACAVLGSFPLGTFVPLFLGSVFWTLVYDTIYGHQDKSDDRKVGVKSTALLFGDSTKGVLTLFSALFLSALVLSGYNAGLKSAYYACTAIVGAHLAWQITTVDLDKPADCMAKFVSNQWVGLIIFLGITAGKFA